MCRGECMDDQLFPQGPLPYLSCAGLLAVDKAIEYCLKSNLDKLPSHQTRCQLLKLSNLVQQIKMNYTNVLNPLF